MSPRERRRLWHVAASGLLTAVALFVSAAQIHATPTSPDTRPALRKAILRATNDLPVLLAWDGAFCLLLALLCAVVALGGHGPLRGRWSRGHRPKRRATPSWAKGPRPPRRIGPWS